MRISRLFVSLLLVGFAAFSAAYQEEVEEAIEEGRTRFDQFKAPKQQPDKEVTCDFNKYDHIPYDAEDAPSQIREISTKLELELPSKWTRIDLIFPKKSKPEDATTKYFNYYSPDGAILYMDIARPREHERGPDDPPYSAADVSWTLFKQLVDTHRKAKPGSSDYSNIKYLMFHPVITDGVDEVFEDFKIKRAVRTFTENDENLDGFFAFLGLDIGGVVSGLLRFHNQQMGGKRIKSVRAWKDQEGQPTVMWELENRESG